MPDHDPATDPRPGDVVRVGAQERTVVRIERCGDIVWEFDRRKNRFMVCDNPEIAQRDGAQLSTGASS